MAEDASSGRVVVLSRDWAQPHDEAAFALRTVAAAMSRLTAVDVVVPGPPGTRRADGAFDLLGIGHPTAGSGWPAPGDATWPDATQYDLVVVAELDDDARSLAEHLAPRIPVARVTSVAGRGLEMAELAVGFGGDPSDSTSIGLHVPVHPMAATRRHVGLGFTGYMLVLSDRAGGTSGVGSPTALAAWLAARFADRHLVVVEDGVASVFRLRSLRGRVDINTRADLWRLVAHARMTVDLAPGPLLARECVESLRYGVPIVTPAGTPAARLAAAGGGLWYRDPAELLGCVEALDDPAVRDGLGTQGKVAADEWYGDPARLVDRVRTATSAWTVRRATALPAGGVPA